MGVFENNMAVKGVQIIGSYYGSVVDLSFKDNSERLEAFLHFYHDKENNMLYPKSFSVYNHLFKEVKFCE